MPQLIVRDMTPADEYYVGACTHINESAENDACCQRRLVWLKKLMPVGLRVKVAVLDDKPVGFLYLMPIEVSPWGPLGKDLMVIPCLFVAWEAQKQGISSALMVAAEKETRQQGRKALVTIGYFHDFWFMPATFFQRQGYSVIQRVGTMALLWKVFDPSAQEPQLLAPDYQFEPAPGKVVVDLFWNTFCQTSVIEAQRVREVAAEFGDAVILNEYCADERPTLLKYQISRGLFVNGKEIGWGYEVPKDGLREALTQALTV